MHMLTSEQIEEAPKFVNSRQQIELNLQKIGITKIANLITTLVPLYLSRITSSASTCLTMLFQN